MVVSKSSRGLLRLNVLGVEDAPAYFQGGAERAGLDDAHRACWFGQPQLVVVKDVNVPGVRVDRAVLKGLELVGHRARRQHVTITKLVVDADDVTSRV